MRNHFAGKNLVFLFGPRNKRKFYPADISRHTVCIYTTTKHIISNTLSPPLTLCQGVVTRTVLAEAGVYELDGRILLYLTHCPSPSVSRGVRPGATLRLANVHVLRPDDPRFRAAASGFYLCPYSSLRVLRFSPTNCGYQVRPGIVSCFLVMD